MIEVEIDQGDLRELMRALNGVLPKELLKGELDGLGRRVVDIAGVYPPAVGTSRRTGLLARSWYHRVWGLDLKVGNLARYAGYVHGDEQVGYHRQRGWRRVFDVAKDELGKMMDKLEKEVARLWR